MTHKLPVELLRHILLEQIWLSPTNEFLAVKFEKWAHI